MDNSVIEYLKTQRVGVLAVEMPDGSPHAATVHFAHTESPLVFYFETNRDYFDIACRRLRGDEARPNPSQPSLF